MKHQSGFTLIELIAVIVILGILAATALPRFIDMSDAAEQAAVDGVAANLGSAMALNYAGAIAADAGLSATPHVGVEDCEDGALLLIGGLPADYTITPAPIAGLGTAVVCTLSGLGTPAKTASFQGIGAP